MDICSSQNLQYLVAYGPGCFDVVSDLFVGPRESTAVDTFRVIDFETIFVVTVDEDKVAGRSEITWANGADEIASFVKLCF